MRTLLSLLIILAVHNCYSQELDIFQKDSIYAINKISTRTMYAMNGGALQKEMVTHYNTRGQIIKQFWYWNGEKHFHNVETFRYSGNGQVSSLIDSAADGKIVTTAFYYDDNQHLQKRISLQGKDTTDFRTYPDKDITIHCWYMKGKPYRTDTTIYETSTAKLDFWGSEKVGYSEELSSWQYRFRNEFDTKGNLLKVSSNIENPYKSFTRYSYDERSLLIRKQEILRAGQKETIKDQYYFKYK